MSVQDETFDRINKAIEAGLLDISNAKPFIDQILLPDLRQRLTTAGLAAQIPAIEGDLANRIRAEANAAEREARLHRFDILEAAWDAMKERAAI